MNWSEKWNMCEVASTGCPSAVFSTSVPRIYRYPPDDFLSFRIPHNELFVRMFHGVELIQVECFARTASSSAEGYLAQTAYFANDVGRVLPCDDVYFVMAFVG
jgi:hypothetical protein